MTTLREAAQQALEALEWHYRQGHSNTIGGFRLKIDEKALRELRAALAQQAEPLNLTDPAVQKRLAAQWGYVLAAQAEPVEPVATLIARRNDILRMAREADREWDCDRSMEEWVECFAALVAAAEREACAALLEANGMQCGEESLSRLILETNAAAIRARTP